MRLFISYARVDKPLCTQIVDTLDVHEVWYDHRLTAGQKWWEEILRRITWCEGFVYLLSKESIASEYCRKEFQVAKGLGKRIFPVLIHGRIDVPEWMNEYQYVDMSNGLDVKAVKQLLNSIYVAGRNTFDEPTSDDALSSVLRRVAQPPGVELVDVIAQAAEALDSNDFDKAVFLIKNALANGYESRFVNLQEVLKEAEQALERQSYLREAEREYRPIVALIKRQRTFALGCKAFMAYREHFADYDPDKLADICLGQVLPIPEWCSIPAGEVVIEREKKRVIHHIDAFRISKYPVTNAQFQTFIAAPDGYRNDKWWGFSPEACEWHHAHPEPLPIKFEGNEHPRVNVCWYEAMAYCAWLSEKTGLKITLPTEQQWQRAAQGDTTNRYPWGGKFDKSRCNTSEAGFKRTTPVSQFPTGISPFGVYDMAGNAWEWCLTRQSANHHAPLSVDEDHGKQSTTANSKYTCIVRGGSFLGNAERARNSFYFKLDPVYRYFTIGFRVVALP